MTACFPKAGFHTTKVDKVNKVDGVDNIICPYAPLPNDWNAYLDALSTNTRQKIRRLLKYNNALMANYPNFSSNLFMPLMLAASC